jgi:hypothetical protein
MMEISGYFGELFIFLNISKGILSKQLSNAKTILCL